MRVSVLLFAGLREAVGPTPPARSRSMRPPIEPSRQQRADLAVRRFGSRAAGRGAILIAGCRPEQVSADAYIDGDYHGALTYYLCKAVMETEGGLTYRQLIERVRRALREHRFEQVPQLEGPASLVGGRVFSPLAELVES